LLYKKQDNVDTVQPYVFLSSEEESNRRVPCRGSGVPSINLGRWKEEPKDSKPTQFLATDSLMSKLNPGNEDLLLAPDASQMNDSAFEDLAESRQPPEIAEESGFVNEIPKQLAENLFYDFLGDSDRDLSENSILELFAKEGRMKERRRK
jgi:hypothetical protein